MSSIFASGYQANFSATHSLLGSPLVGLFCFLSCTGCRQKNVDFNVILGQDCVPKNGVAIIQDTVLTKLFDNSGENGHI